MNGFLKSACVLLSAFVCSVFAQPVTVFENTQDASMAQSSRLGEWPPSVINESSNEVHDAHSLPANVIAKTEHYYRVNKGAKGIYFVIQDFYITGEKRTDPYLVTDLEKMRNNYFDLVDYNRFSINGLLIIWFKNGLVQQKGVFNQEGKRKGLWVSWYEDGQKKASGHYRNNFKEGAWTVWYQNGRRMQKGYYQQDSKEGVWIYWYGNGKKKEAGRYNQDQRVEHWSFWDNTGRLIKSKELKKVNEEGIVEINN